jgi:endonuclease YncB( thermonuclease family)
LSITSWQDKEPRAAIQPGRRALTAESMSSFNIFAPTFNARERILAAFGLLLIFLSLLSVAACREKSTYVYPAGGEARDETVPPASNALSSPQGDQASDIQTFSARVIRVIDGDTIVVVDSNSRTHDVRLQGIDAPEKRQAFGRRSKEALATIVLNQSVYITPKKTDRYKRIVSTVRRDDMDVALEQVREGMAWHFERYAHEQTQKEREEYEFAQREARANRQGLWVDPHPVAPWNFKDTGKRGADLFVSGPFYDGHVIGHRQTRRYYLPGCPGYARIKARNRLLFASEDDARQAGFTRSEGC